MLAGFGGPRSRDEILSFLKSVTEGTNVPESRLAEVAAHYQAVGGASPYNAHTQRQKEALEAELEKRGLRTPVVCGFRHSTPSLKDAFLAVKEMRARRVIVFVLSSLRSYSSFDKYRERIEEAKALAGAENIGVEYTAPFYAHPLFIEAQAARVAETLTSFSVHQKARTFFLFSAHSIPSAIAQKSRYAEEFAEGARLTAERLGLESWGLAYQSRSGNPREPWLGPSVNEALSALDRARFDHLMLIPLGFLCDNVEVIYDLDIELKAQADSQGVGYFRAKTVMDHTAFIRLMADLVTPERTVSGRRVAVVGGGISGLSAANKISECARAVGETIELRLFESGPRLGGAVETRERDGFLMEQGPDSFFSEKPAALELCRRLGLEAELTGTRPENRKIFIVERSKLVPLPEGFYLIAPTSLGPFLRSSLFSLPGKARMFCERFVRPRGGDETVAAFIKRRFGGECLEKVGQAMVGGIYTGDPERLSLSAALPRFKELETKYGSVTRGLAREMKGQKKTIGASGPRYGLFLSFKNGMETFTRALISRLPGETLRPASPVTRVAYDAASKKWVLTFAQGPAYAADVLCLALPPRLAAGLLKESAPDLAAKLESFQYESVIALNLAYRRRAIGHALNGFGFLSGRGANRAVIACTFASQKFAGRAPEDGTLLRAFVGGAFGREYLRRDDADIVCHVKNELAGLLNITEEPLFYTLHRHNLSMVQYPLNHPALIKEISHQLTRCPGLFLTGSAYQGPGIPDCIAHAESQAEAIYASLYKGNHS